MESNSDNISQPESDRSGKHSSGRSHRRHHKHSSGRNNTSAKSYQYSRRPRLEDRPKRDRQKKIESFFTKNILNIFGIIFIAGAIWFGIDTWKSIENPVVLSIEKSKHAELVLSSQVNSLMSSIFTPAPLQPTRYFKDTTFIVFLMLPLVFILASMGISIRRKNLLLKTISFLAWISIAVWLLIKFFITKTTFIFFRNGLFIFNWWCYNDVI